MVTYIKQNVKCVILLFPFVYENEGAGGGSTVDCAILVSTFVLELNSSHEVRFSR